MEKKNTGLIVLIIVLSLLVLGLGGYIVYDKVLSKEDVSTDTQDVNDGLIDGINFKIISFDSAEIIGDEKGEGNIHMISVHGKMELFYDEEFYDTVRVSGYCIDENSNKHLFSSSISNNASEFHLYTFVTDEELLKEDIDWNNTKIIYCKIDKLLARDLKNNNDEYEKDINYEYKS